MPDSDTDTPYSADRLVYWIGGSPGAGKSSVTRVLAQRHGLWTYYCDWHQLGHERQRADRIDGFPALPAWNRKDMDERWLTTPPEQMARDVIAVWIERFPLVVADVGTLSPGSCLVEGAGCFPASVLPSAGTSRRAVWLIPTPDCIRQVREDRFALGNSSAIHTSEPERALRNIIERDILLAAYVESEASHLGGRVIPVNGTRSIGEMADEIEAHFGLMSLVRYVGQYARGDGRLLSIELREDALIFGSQGSTRCVAMQPRGQHVFRLGEGLFVGELIRFELDRGRDPIALIVASEIHSRIP